MRVKRKIIEIDESLCNGCGNCVSACAESAIRIVDGKARLISDKYCDGLGACLGECPTGALKVIEREADQFDHEAVAAQATQGCPSAQVRTMAAGSPVNHSDTSALTHWPVQIRLVPPTAPFLRQAHLLVVADCVPVAYPNFHADFLAGKVVMVGCPKFDDTDLYVQRFADIFATADIQSVTIVVMQVPCCQALPVIVARGMALAGKHVPAEKVVVSLDGHVSGRQTIVAA